MTTTPPASPPAPQTLGVWLVGARGSIATALAVGLSALVRGRVAPVGLVSESAPFGELPLVRWNSLVLAGNEVRAGSLRAAAAELVSAHILPAELVSEAGPELDAMDSRVQPGLGSGAGASGDPFEAEARRLGALGPREQVAAIVAQLEAFRASLGGAPVLVVNVASTEAWREARADWSDLAAFESSLDRGERPPASMLYAFAAFCAGCAHVNFTPSLGSTPLALRAFARAKGLVHAGSDGKTGETLLKTTLAPMFAARALKVLAWQGYNMLGNRDGEVLADPAHKRVKVESKDEALRQLLGDPSLHSHVAIDYVPSLGDWKTAMDYVHFEGFLGVRMSLSFTWHGSDSALAVPLVLDLVRLVELSQRRGEVGELAHLACFFKSPLAGGTHDFGAQYRMLLEWAAQCACPPAPR